MLAVLSQLFLNCSQLSVHCSQHVPSAPQAGSQLFSNSLNYFSTVPPNVSQLRHPQFGIPLFSTLCQMSSVLYWLFPTISQLCLNCFSQFLNLFPTVCQMAYRLFWTLSQISFNYIIKCLPTLFQPCLNSLNYVANCVSAVLQPCPQMFPRYQLLVLITVSQLLLSFKLWPSATCFEAARSKSRSAWQILTSGCKQLLQNVELQGAHGTVLPWGLWLAYCKMSMAANCAWFCPPLSTGSVRSQISVCGSLEHRTNGLYKGKLFKPEIYWPSV